jgi:hypothetical protein
MQSPFRLFLVLMVCAITFCALALWTSQLAWASDDDISLLQADAGVFGTASIPTRLNAGIMDSDLVWTDSLGETWNKSQIVDNGVPALSGTDKDVLSGRGRSARSIKARAYGQAGIVQENTEKLYILRIWVKPAKHWRLLIYQSVRIGTPPAESEKGDCDNPCRTVPFEPRNDDERDVIHAYQAVERAVTAHDSAAWGSHIAEEFFAVTSNSDRPLDKATRMSGLDKQKVAGIAPFPLVSARMFQFGNAMVMISEQQPLHGLPLHVTRVWFKRNGEWVEGYSYQTTIESGSGVRTITPHGPHAD